MSPKLYMRLSVHRDQLGTRILRAEVPGYGAVAGYCETRLPGMLKDLVDGVRAPLRDTYLDPPWRKR